MKKETERTENNSYYRVTTKKVAWQPKKVAYKVASTVISKGLTKAEKEVLRLISQEFLTKKQIIQRRNCTRQALEKIIRNLKTKGVINSGFEATNGGGCTRQPTSNFSNNLIRLHGQEFNIKLIYQDSKYQKILKECNLLFIAGHTIRLFKNSIEVYASEGANFYGETASEAERKSLDYWFTFFNRLEHELKIIIVKPRASNIKIVNNHFERGDSQICEEAMKQGRIIEVYSDEDGKRWFWTDLSSGGKNDETGHPLTAKEDREKIDKFLNDIRNNNPPTPSELSLLIQGLAVTQQGFDTNIKKHFEVLNKIGNAVDELRKEVAKLNDKK